MSVIQRSRVKKFLQFTAFLESGVSSAPRGGSRRSAPGAGLKAAAPGGEPPAESAAPLPPERAGSERDDAAVDGMELTEPADVDPAPCRRHDWRT